jgi:hypothetical protein
MRVTVQIDDERPGTAPAPEGGPMAVPLPPAASPAGTPAAGGSGGPEAGGGPSPELAARAARLGAISAGPAPSGAPVGAAGAPGFRVEGLGPPAAGAPGAAQDAPADHSAGPARVASQEGP